jgi:glycerate kinase
VLFAGSVVREEGLDTSMFQEVIDVGNPALDKQAAVLALREAAARWATTARNMKPHDARDRERERARRDEHMDSGGTL